MSKTLQIKKTTLEKIVKSLFTINSVSIQSNFDHIKNLIFREMSDNTLEKVAELMLTDEPSLKIKYVYHDKERNIVYKEDTVSPFDLFKLNKHDSLYLQQAINIINKPVEDAQIITRTDQITL